MMKMSCDRCTGDGTVVTYHGSFKFPPSDVLAKHVSELGSPDLCEACVEELIKWIRCQ